LEIKAPPRGLPVNAPNAFTNAARPMRVPISAKGLTCATHAGKIDTYPPEPKPNTTAYTMIAPVLLLPGIHNAKVIMPVMVVMIIILLKHPRTSASAPTTSRPMRLIPLINGSR